MGPNFAQQAVDARKHFCIRTFSGKTEALLPVPCTYDLNVSATKYFYALEGGEVPLIFLFSGTVFYVSEAGHLQVQQIPWDSECTYRMPVHVWKALMDHHYPGTAWLSLDRELFDRLYAYRRAPAIYSMPPRSTKSSPCA
jgi:hypothetical protein